MSLLIDQASTSLPRRLLTHVVDVVRIKLPRIMPKLSELGVECRCSIEVVGGKRKTRNKLPARPRLVSLQRGGCRLGYLCSYGP